MLSEIRQLIENHFRSEWDPLLNNIPIDYENSFTTRSPPFIRLHIIPGASENIGLNEPPMRTGVVSVMIFIEGNTGTGQAWSIGDSIRVILENRRVGKVRLLENSLFDLGQIEGESTHVFESVTIYETEI